MARRGFRLLLAVALLAVLGILLGWNTPAFRWLGQAVELALAGGLQAEGNRPLRPPDPLPPTIAHAGGGIGPIVYSNSLEALEAGWAKGLTAFEVDLHWTRDGHLVLLHDWDYHRQFLFPGSGLDVLDRGAFLRLHMRDGLTPLAVEGLMAWLDRRPGARIISDVKEDNLMALARIAQNFPGHLDRIVPQIFAFREYAPVRAMGYRAILLTLYRRPYLDPLVVRFAESRALAGVVMTAERASGPLPRALGRVGVPAIAYTVNDPGERKRLEANGVDGFITDAAGDAALGDGPPAAAP